MTTQNGHSSRQPGGPIREALEGIENGSKHHIAGSLYPQAPITHKPGSPKSHSVDDTLSKGFWDDITTMRWMKRPSSSFKMLIIPIILYVNWALVASKFENPFQRIIFISNRIGDTQEGHSVYAKSYWDLAFVAYYIIVFSFIRQSLTIYFLKPLARRNGIYREAKLDRFAEQGYAVIYFTASGLLGLYTMYYYLPTWYFRTEYFWINYPHWEMVGSLKAYYLLQFAYWCQQAILIVLRVEKPRSDFNVLVAHHVVTLWLIGGSYLLNMTPMGNAVFLTMDWSDAFFSLSKCFNYLQMEKTKTIAFAWFTCVWTYLRHYLNIVMLWSVWNEFDLIPETSKQWSPETGFWMAPWMRYQIFLPMFFLQLLNLFWYFLIWRILLRAIFSSTLEDDRSDDEDEAAEPASQKKKSD